MLAGDGAAMLVYGLLSGPIFLAFLGWFWIRVYYLPVPRSCSSRSG